MSQDDRYQDTATEIERVDRDLLVSASPEDVWEAVTHDGWLADRVELELAPGGAARFSGRDGVRTGWVEEARPPWADGEGRLVFWWGPDGEPATRVELTLAPEGERSTRLWVSESRPLEVLDLVGIPASDPGRSRHGPAMLALA